MILLFVHSECSIHSPLIRYATRNWIIKNKCRTTIKQAKRCRISTLHFYFSSLQTKRQRKMFEHQNAKRRTKQKNSVRYIFAKSIEIHIGLWYNKSTAKVACFSPFRRYSVTTLLTTVWRLNGWNGWNTAQKLLWKCTKMHPKDHSLKMYFRVGMKKCPKGHFFSYDRLRRVMSYDALCAVMMHLRCSLK